MESICDDNDNNLRNMGSVTTFLQGRQSHVDELSNGILRMLIEARVAEGFTGSTINSLLQSLWEPVNYVCMVERPFCLDWTY